MAVVVACGLALLFALRSAAQDLTERLFLEADPAFAEEPVFQAAASSPRSRFAVLNPSARSWLAASLAALPLRFDLEPYQP